jgi:excisionase family DNA binding protein
MPFERSIEHWEALPFLSVKETAAVLGLGDRSVRKLLEESELEARTIFGKKMIVVSSVQRFVGLNGKTTTPTNPVSLSPKERQIVRELGGGVAS